MFTASYSASKTRLAGYNRQRLQDIYFNEARSQCNRATERTDTIQFVNSQLRTMGRNPKPFLTRFKSGTLRIRETSDAYVIELEAEFPPLGKTWLISVAPILLFIAWSALVNVSKGRFNANVATGLVLILLFFWALFLVLNIPARNKPPRRVDRGRDNSIQGISW